MLAEQMNDRNSHRHKCENCGLVWQHSNAMRNRTDAHTCVCGKQEWIEYTGHEKADIKTCGRPSVPLGEDY